MEVDKLRQKIVAAARRQTPSDAVPFAFEKRVMARLAEASAPDGWVFWGRALWRAAVPCILIVIFSGWWLRNSGPAQNPDLPQAIENAVLGELNQNVASIW